MEKRFTYPLTMITTNKVKFKLIDVEYKAFDKIIQILIQNNLLDYLDFNNQFNIHTYARKFQLGAFIIQVITPINFHKRNSPHPKQGIWLWKRNY